VTRLCKALNVSPSGYYAWRRRPVSAREMANRELVDQAVPVGGIPPQRARTQSRGRYRRGVDAHRQGQVAQSARQLGRGDRNRDLGHSEVNGQQG